MLGNKNTYYEGPAFERRQLNRSSPQQQGSPLAAVNQQLQQEITQRKHGEDQLKINVDRLEQRIKQQSVDLLRLKEQLEKLHDRFAERTPQRTAAREHVQQPTAERQHVEKEPSGQPAELVAANQQLRQELARAKQSEQRLNERIAVLTRTNEELQARIAELSQEEVELLEEIIDAEQPGEAVEVLNPQELKALSELAKRLAR